MKAQANSNDPLVFSELGNTVAHVERRPGGALLLVIPMTLDEAAVLLDAANAGIQSGDVNGENAHLGWILGRIAMQRNFAVAERAEVNS